MKTEFDRVSAMYSRPLGADRVSSTTRASEGNVPSASRVPLTVEDFAFGDSYRESRMRTAQAAASASPAATPPQPSNAPRARGLAIPSDAPRTQGNNFVGGDAVQSLRNLLPTKMARTNVISVDEALSHCATKIFGHEALKKRLAMTMGADSFREERFSYFLHGPPGVGKSTIVSMLGELYGRPVIVIRCESLRNREDIVSFADNWKSPGVGQLTRKILECGVRNPIIFFDEIDKISGKGKEEVYQVLNMLMGEETTSYYDEFLKCDVDISRVCFFAAGNRGNAFAEMPWLESRFNRTLPVHGYTRNELRVILTDYVVPRLHQRQWTAQTPARMRVDLSLTTQAADFIIDKYIAAMGESHGARQLVAWMREIESGHLMLPNSPQPIDVQWLEENWSALFPGLSTDELS